MRDDCLRRLTEKVAADEVLWPKGGEHLVLVSQIEAGTPDLTGFCYWQEGSVPVSPRDFSIFDVLEQMRELENPPWVAAFFRWDRSTGEVMAEFEYENSARWAVTPTNVQERAREWRPEH